MNKLILGTMLAAGLCGCENETVVREVVKQTVVHDTIVKYKTDECSKEYSVDADPVDGNTYVFEIHSKKTDEIVFYLQPIVIWHNVKHAGGETITAESDMCKHFKQEHIIGCYVDARYNNKTIHFVKEWPDTEFYLVETWSVGVKPSGNTVNFVLQSPK